MLAFFPKGGLPMIAAGRSLPISTARFGALVREKLRGDELALRRGYFRLFVSQIVLSPTEIRISGSRQALARAVSRISADGQLVPSFDREWCPIDHQNGHSNHWEISLSRG